MALLYNFIQWGTDSFTEQKKGAGPEKKGAVESNFAMKQQWRWFGFITINEKYNSDGLSVAIVATLSVFPCYYMGNMWPHAKNHVKVHFTVLGS